MSEDLLEEEEVVEEKVPLEAAESIVSEVEETKVEHKTDEDTQEGSFFDDL